MITLNPNTATAQSVYVTPFQGKKDYTTGISHYLFEIMSLQTNEKQYLVASVQQDNARYTECLIYTDAKLPLLSKVLLTESGLYSYVIYGQTNNTNVDPNNAAVVGELSRGMLTVNETADAWTEATMSIPNNIVYYE